MPTWTTAIMRSLHGNLAFIKMEDDYALQDVHTLTVAETFMGVDNTPQHWPGGSCYSRKEECSKNKKEKRTKAAKWSIVLKTEGVF